MSARNETSPKTALVVKILSDLVVTFAYVARQIKQNWKGLHEPPLENELNEVETQLNKKLAEALSERGISGHEPQLIAVTGSPKLIADFVRKLKRTQSQQDMVAWLSPPDLTQAHKIARKTRREGTNNWFFENEVFGEWKATGPLLWISGITGTGRTVLSASIVESLREQVDEGSALVAYFYFDFKDPQKQTIKGLLSSIIVQLCTHFAPHWGAISRLYSEYGNGQLQPSDEVLIQSLKDLIAQTEESTLVYILMDAPDECPATSATGAIYDLLKELVELGSANVRLCVTTGVDYDTLDFMEPLASHSIEMSKAAGHIQDIHEHIREFVATNPRTKKWRIQERDGILNTLTEKCGGSFLWVDCQLIFISNALPANVRRILETLRTSLDGTYERVIRRVREEHWEFTQHLFACLAVPTRPLLLSELGEVLSVDFEEPLMEFQEDWRPDDMEETIGNTCGSLMYFFDSPEGRRVEYPHYSVLEFMTSRRLIGADPRISRFRIIPGPAHTVLTMTCLGVLVHVPEDLDKANLHRFPLIEYAARWWVYHYKLGGMSLNLRKAMERLFDKSKNYFSIWVWLYDIEQPDKKPLITDRPGKPALTPLYYSVLCGFPHLAEYLAYMNQEDVNVEGGTLLTPLRGAVLGKHNDIVRVLLRRGADVNRRYESGTMLQEVTNRGDLELVRLMLEHNADVNAEGGVHGTALESAAAGGHEKIIRAMLRHGADVNLRSEGPYGSPLQAAARNGHLEVVHLLLDRGADVNVPAGPFGTALHGATENGHAVVAQLLRERGAHANDASSDASVAAT
ncbi:hypothetical protein BC834DRAFT_905504 [Gloeopeniophorella convolvens]|nr:hypothetical protein BC834DRAFT_905504 [Gloeopeniophorella convolvens]